MILDMKLKAVALVSGFVMGIGLTGAHAQAPAPKGPSAPVASKATTAGTPVEQQKQQSEDAVKKSLNADAMAAIKEATAAVDALKQGKDMMALAAVERATGKLDILLARNPAAALLPVRSGTVVINSAPTDVKAIRDITDGAERAVDNKDYALARVLLASLQDEIRVRTYNLPLATYPQAMKDAARLIDQKKPAEARSVLETALDALVVVDHVYPVPLIDAQADVKAAESQKASNKNEALRLLAKAKQELGRAEALGYAGKDDPDYAALNKSIDDVEKQVSGNQTAVSFQALKDRLSAFFKRQTDAGKSDSMRKS